MRTEHNLAHCQAEVLTTCLIKHSGVTGTTTAGNAKAIQKSLMGMQSPIMT